MKSVVFVRGGQTVNTDSNDRKGGPDNDICGLSGFARWKSWARDVSVAVATSSVMVASVAFGATLTVNTLIDADNNAGTGCSVSTANGAFAGVDRVLNTTVLTDTAGYRIGSITMQSCSGGSLGAPVVIDASSTPLARGNGTNGATAVETYIPNSFLPAAGQKMRIGVTTQGSDGLAGADALTVSGTGPILVDGPPLVVVPTMAKLSLALTALFLALSVWYARRRGWHGLQLVVVAAFAISMSGQLIAAIVRDGFVGDWSGIAPVATDPAGDAPVGTDITNVYSTVDGGNVYFRIDTSLNAPPAANAQTVISVVGQPLSITLTGSDYESSPLTFSVVTQPTEGVLTGTAPNLTYTPNASAAASDSFTFKANDGSLDSVPATVTIGTTRAPAITSANSVTFVPTQANTFTVVANGLPVPATSIGTCAPALPASITFTANAVGGGVIAGNPTTGQAGVYVCPITSTNGVLPNATQSFTLTVGGGPSITSAATLSVPELAAFTHTVTTSSVLPISAMALTTGALPTGATFAYAGAPASTATVSGTPAVCTRGSYPVVLSATNSVGSTTQNFNLTVRPVNQAPSFVKGADVTVLEDAAAQTVAGWATARSAGAPCESAQTLSFEITANSNPALFSAVPAVNGTNGDLTFTPAANANGTATITLRIKDNGGVLDGGVDASAAQTFSINVTSVNDAPSFTKGADQAVLQNAGAQTVANWATAISAGPTDEAAQTLTFTVTNNNNALFSVQPAIAPNGTLTYTPAPNANGSAIVTVVLKDSGGTANGGTDTAAAQTFNVAVTAVNLAPSFTKGADITVLEDAAAFSAPWATAISAGSPGEAGQVLNFIVTNGNNSLFTVQPAVSPTGALTFTAAPNANGSAVVSVALRDNGGTANGGVDTSAVQTFNVNVTAVNDVPSFTKGANITVLENSGAFAQAGWATALSAGPADEIAQTLSFVIASNTNPGLFSAQPVFSPTGGLSFTPTAGQSGVATVGVQIKDNGGTANGGVDTSATQTFTITVTGINHVPSFTKGGDQTVLEDAGAQTVAGWATAISDGDGNTQTLTFQVTNNTNAALFSAGPAIAANGTLTYTPAANANGSATITINLKDNGGTANGGVDTSAPQTFTINVTAVNDAPSFIKGADQTVSNAAGAVTLPGWASSISAGPADESAQTLTFNVTGNTNPGLFTAVPSLSSTGVLTFTPNPASTGGLTTVTLTLQDSGGTANGGVNTSPSQSFTITVQAAPAVTTNPVSQTVSAGSNASFSAAASGNPTPTVQWQVSTDGGATFANVSGATSTTLLLTAVAVGQNGNQYRAVFTNGTGTATTTAATLTVTAGPVVTTNPVDVTVNAGGTAVFTAAASGTPTPTVQWQFSTNGGVSFANVAGAITPTLTVPGVTAGQNGTQFRAVFTNGSGTATTTAATMTVNFAPTVTTNPTSQAISTGSNASFSAAASGNPTPTVQWQVSTNGGATFANVSGATSTTLLLTAVAVGQNGNQYRAVFTNGTGTATTTAATLTVTAGPVVTTNPVDVTVNAGGTAVFTAAASGTPTPTVQWQFSTNGGVSFANVAGAITPTLTVPGVTAGQNGTQFRAVFTNGSGTATTTAATMTVNFAPTVTTNPVSQTVAPAATATFTAAASGNPAPTVQWQVSTNGGGSFSDIGGATATTYSFVAAGTDTGKQFRAVFTNSVGSAATTAAVLTTVDNPPTATGLTGLPAQASVMITYPAGKLTGTDAEGAVTVATTPDSVCAGCAVTIRADGGFDFTPPPNAAGTTNTFSFTYHVVDSASQSSPAVTVSFTVAGPAIYFVKSAAVGTGNCTLGNECTLSTALTNIGASTNAHIFLSDANTHSTASVTHNSGGRIIGQGVVGASFDSVFGIAAPAQGTLATRPLINQTKPTVNSTIAAHSTSHVRGLIIKPAAGANKGLVASGKTGLVLSELAIDMTANGATGNALEFVNSSGDYTGGGLVITATSGKGLTATGGGTLTVQGTGNKVTTTTGTALEVNGSTIGAAHMTFESINSGTAASGPANGILLSSTGTSGRLIVTGTGAAGTGGTVQKSTGAGVSLTSTNGPSLSWMTISGSTGSGINGTSVTGSMLLDRLTVSGNSTLASTNCAPISICQAGIFFYNLTGSGHTISNSTIFGSAENNIHVENDGANALGGLTLTGNTIRDNAGLGGLGNGLHIKANGTASMTVTATSNVFAANLVTAIQADAGGTTNAINLTATNNAMHNAGVTSTQGGTGIGMSVNANSTPTLTFNITGNTIGKNGATNAPLGSNGITISENTTAHSIVTGNITNNTIFGAGAAAVGGGIRVFPAGVTGSLWKVRVDGNTLSNIGAGYGIFVGSGEQATTGDSDVHAGVINNNVAVLSTAFDAIRVQSRVNGTMCARITGNTGVQAAAGNCANNLAGLGFCGIQVRQANTSIFALEGGNTNAQIQTNNPGTALAAVGIAGTISTVATNFCNQIP